jgi:hypothetical protein
MMGYRLVFPISVALSFLDWRIGIGYLMGYSLGRYVDPDWDLMSANSAEGRIVNEIPILGHFLYGISSSYGSLWRKCHRSVWTHYPILSTGIRLAFILWLPFMLGDAYGINFIGGGWIWFWISLWLGLSCADGLHLYFDFYPSKE